jgi:hypothetical protein
VAWAVASATAAPGMLFHWINEISVVGRLCRIKEL